MRRLGAVRAVVLGGVCCLMLPAFGLERPGSVPTTHARVLPAVTPWQQAERDRQALEAEPASAHTRAGYTRMMDEYRAIYHDNPRDLHAAPAIGAVAELLAEQGRQFDEEKSLRAAIGQYEFLRTQYPSSPLREAALLAEGRIAEDDLGDEGLAREKFRALVKEAPKSQAAVEARAELVKLSGSARPAGASRAGSPTHGGEAALHGAQSGQSVDATGAAGAPLPAQTAPVVAKTAQGPLALVSGVRHWSTPTYTRVAIDLGSEVTFQAARVPHPDRIFFDLHGARLAPELVGKSFDVTDDGYLKRIRAAQAAGDVTRVVLDVSDVSEYSAFLLPNPYRLIIDIHGKAGAKTAAPGNAAGSDAGDGEQLAPVPAAADRNASAAANRSGLPAMAPTTDLSQQQQPAWVTVPGAKPAQTPAAVQPGKAAPVLVATARTARPVPNTVAVKAPATASEVAEVSAAPGRVDATAAPTSQPIAAVVKTRGAKSSAATPVPASAPAALPGAASPASAPVKAAQRTADGETSLVRALGLKIGRIVIDAGHGGHDSGTLGVDGIQEKDVVLDVALRLGKLLHDRLGAEIIYTRSDDTFIPLETRTAIANKAQADLFLSIHANSSPDATARGVETYYLNFTSDRTALDVATRENAVAGESIHQLSDLVKKIALKDKIDESREFAADVESSLYAGLAKGNEGLKNRGVKKAPFVVLIGANMPSILAEISFVTNARDAGQLRQPEYRERVAESLFNGVARYESGLAGARPAAPPPVTRAAVQSSDTKR